MKGAAQRTRARALSLRPALASRSNGASACAAGKEVKFEFPTEQ